MASTDTTGFQQAQLLIEGQDALTCWFNPTDYTVSKANQWSDGRQLSDEFPQREFVGGDPRELRMTLLFDAADTDNDDVAGVTDQLFSMLEVQPDVESGKKTARPPTVTFSWGQVSSFTAVATSLRVRYTLFDVDGTPLRAVAEVVLTQVEKVVGAGGGARQNPTTSGIAGLRMHTVRDGDSLQSIAHAMYGDPTRWRPIAEANGIDDPLALQRGRTLTVPRSES
jgi:contractile injection system tube protein/LysM domain-containing protein